MLRSHHLCGSCTGSSQVNFSQLDTGSSKLEAWTVPHRYRIAKIRDPGLIPQAMLLSRLRMEFTKPTYQTAITKLIIVHILRNLNYLLLYICLSSLSFFGNEGILSHISSSTEAKHQCQQLIFQQNLPRIVDTALLLSSSLAKCTKPEEVRSKVSYLSYPSHRPGKPHQDATITMAECLKNSFQSSLPVCIKNSPITYWTWR